MAQQSFDDLYCPLVAGPEEDCIMFCRDRGIIPDNKDCPSCASPMGWKRGPSSLSSDCFYWRCPTCKLTRSIRESSILHKKKLSFKMFIKFLAAWSNRHNTGVTISAKIGLSRHSVSVWRKLLNNDLAEFLFDNPVRLGGPGIVVELDESKFGKRKYNRGSRRDGTWVFGMVERASNLCFLLPCPGNRRDRATLEPIIQSYIRPGSVVMTDGWAAYGNLQNLGYHHLVVNHSIEFVNPITGAHINTQEGLWRHAKKTVDGNKYVTDALIEYMWRRRFNATRGVTQIQYAFNAACMCLKRVYDN